MSEDIVKESIKCLANMEIKETTYQVARSVVLDEIERLNKKIEQYENPEDMTLMFMWCDEKAKKEIERLNNIINELEKYINEEYVYDDNGMKIFDVSELQDKLQELKGSDKE